MDWQYFHGKDLSLETIDIMAFLFWNKQVVVNFYIKATSILIDRNFSLIDMTYICINKVVVKI